ncbi:hypothetical protein [Pedobacter alpinus]|uniref:Uncharacterized protein n=1 Tax=Pedobacter alpinus TaxID=1590643 RepID=A0ABW5TT71_9SPHI
MIRITRKLLLFSMFLCFNFAYAFANQTINSFVVKENLLKGQKLAIIATDSLDNPIENINGVYNFSVNGFKQELNFNVGVAVCELQIEKSAFIFIKHLNDGKSPSNLYFVYKKDTNLNPIKISWYILLAIPLGLVLIGYMFRKMIGIVIFILSIIFYFYYSKGLSIPTFFESIIDGIKNLI